MEIEKVAFMLEFSGEIDMTVLLTEIPNGEL